MTAADVVWATVTQLSPLLVKTDGAATAVPAKVLGGAYPVGMRVRVAVLGPELLVLGGGDGAWTVPTLGTGVTNLGGVYSTAAYRRGADGRVYLRGAVNAAAGTTLWTMPAGYRPAAQELLGTIGAGPVVARVDVTAAGAVIAQNAAAGTTWVALSGLSYQAEQ